MKVWLLALLTVFSSGVLATDLGRIGVVYPVQEDDLIEFIKTRLQAKMDAGEMDEVNQKMLDRGRAFAANPPGIELPVAQEYKATQIDVEYTLPDDIVDADGKVLFTAGTTVNPLEVHPLTKTLCFIDGRDEEQVAWMMTYCAGDERNKLILTNGDYLKLTEKLDRRLYFDQRGKLVERLGIKAVPSVVRQGGMSLYVEEFPVH